MANVSIKFNNKEFLLACEDGQEEHLEELLIQINKKFNNLKNDLGNLGENKLLLITAVKIMDEYYETKKKVDQKKDELNDPLINDDLIVELGWVNRSQLEDLKNKALIINEHLVNLFSKINIQLVDFKIEFGKTVNDNENKLILADEISPDTCRLWDVKTEKKLDKDRFRKDLGNIIQGYQEVARRLGIMPEETNISEVNFGKTIPIKFKKK